MKTYQCRGLLLLASLLWQPVSLGALVNGDFGTNDFTGWSAQVITCAICDGSDDSVSNLAPPGNDANHDASTGSAELATDDLSFATPDVFSINLFQEFVMDSIVAIGATLELSLDFSFVVGMGDLAIAQLEDRSAVPLATLNLSAGGSFDVTAFAGRGVTLSFLVVDLVDGFSDSLSVDNIVISESVPATSPLPGPLVLLPLAFLLLHRQARLRRG